MQTHFSEPHTRYFVTKLDLLQIFNIKNWERHGNAFQVDNATFLQFLVLLAPEESPHQVF